MNQVLLTVNNFLEACIFKTPLAVPAAPIEVSRERVSQQVPHNFRGQLLLRDDRLAGYVHNRMSGYQDFNLKHQQKQKKMSLTQANTVLHCPLGNRAHTPRVYVCTDRLCNQKAALITKTKIPNEFGGVRITVT